MIQPLSGFIPGTPSAVTSSGIASIRQQTSATALQMSTDEENLLRMARSSRSAGAEDNLVELKRPIGVVLAEDDNGNVYVETLAPKGNAARSGKVRVFICTKETSQSLCFTCFFFKSIADIFSSDLDSEFLFLNNSLGQGRRHCHDVFRYFWR